MKRYIAFLLALAMILSLAACGKKTKEQESASEEATATVADDSSIKVGFIFPAEAGAPDTEAREDAVRKMQFNTKLEDKQILISDTVSKEDCEKKIKEEIDKGCQLIFACGARYEETVLAMAEEYKDVQFCLEGGKESIDSTLSNVHTFNSRIYESYYVAGVLAGNQINYLLNRGDIVPSECTIGFVAYKECAETTSCIDAFYLGIKKMNSQCNVAVRYVGKRGDYDEDAEAARQLVAQGICFMATYTYTTAPASVCAENGIPMIGNQDNMINIAPKKALTSTYTDWSVYYTEAVHDLLSGKEIAKDWCGGYAEKAVRLTQINDAHVANGTVEKLIELEDDLYKGKVKIFKTEDMTFNSASLATLVKSDDNFKKYKKYVKNGELKEQGTSSTPILEDFIDGISVSTENYIPEDVEESEESSTEEQQ